MRVVCKVLDAPTSAIAGHRAGKGAIALGTMNTPGLKTSKPCLSVFTAAGKEHKYPLDGTSQPAQIHDKFVAQGKVTIAWRNPPRTTMISEARPEVLRNLVHKLQAVLRGETIDTLKEITKEKKSDLGGQVELVVRRREDYPKSGSVWPSASLKKLSLTGIGLKRVDGKWFTCTLLTHLDLSRNQMGGAPDLKRMQLIGKLVNLQVLNLSRNGLGELPAEMISSFPPSLLSLDLSFNLFRSVPSLSTLPALSMLDMANNRLTVLPSELRSRPSLSLNLDNNQIKCLPLMRSNIRHTFSISGNPLNEPASKPKLTNVDSPTMLQLAMQAIRRNRSQKWENVGSPTMLQLVMQSIMRIRIRLPEFLMVRFWEEDGIDFCDYCRVPFAANLLFPFVQPVDAVMLSMQAAFATQYPCRVVACRKCYQRRNPLVTAQGVPRRRAPLGRI